MHDPIEDISIPELTFAEYVASLTITLQERYDLVAKGDRLENDIITLSFCAATPRDHWVRLIGSFKDKNLFELHAKTKTFFLYDFLAYRKIERKSAFPYQGSKHLREYQRSPLQILGISIFLLNHGDLLLRGDPEEVKAFGLNFHARCVAYTKSVSKKKKKKDKE